MTIQKMYNPLNVKPNLFIWIKNNWYNRFGCYSYNSDCSLQDLLYILACLFSTHRFVHLSNVRYHPQRLSALEHSYLRYVACFLPLELFTYHFMHSVFQNVSLR